MEVIWQAGKVCYLPVLADMKTLQFVQYEQDDELQPNQYSIYEPVNHAHAIQPERLDMVIVPLVAFDEQGNRIGTGGGYYDRTFAFMYMHPPRAPFLLGLGYDVQQSQDCQPDPWDIKLNGILTESKLLII
jgi:5-formyltetrahydrofolate cyclo-ligase